MFFPTRLSDPNGYSLGSCMSHAEARIISVSPKESASKACKSVPYTDVTFPIFFPNTLDKSEGYVYCFGAWFHSRVTGHESILRVSHGLPSELSSPSSSVKQVTLASRIQNTHTGT